LRHQEAAEDLSLSLEPCEARPDHPHRSGPTETCSWRIVIVKLVVRAQIFEAMERDLGGAAPREAAGFLFFRLERAASAVRPFVREWSFLAEDDVEVSGGDRFRPSG